MYLYWTKKQKLFDPDIGAYVSFGIGVWIPTAGIRPMLFIPDLSTDGWTVCRLAIRCTLGGLEPSQLLDVVDDFLG